jgi:4-amino-4-deoxy-L-arabinose transferase-like glycosyltransferase
VEPQEGEIGRRERRWTWLLFALALLVRVLFVLLEPETHPVADERTWTNWAVDGIVPRAFNPFRNSMIFYPPFYPYFIAVFYALFRTLTAVKYAQAIVGALLVPAMAEVGRRAFSPRVGLLSAAVAAFYPELVWFSAHFWSETLFTTLLWSAFALLLGADLEAGVGASLLAGLLWGLAILTRETIFYFTPVAALFLAFGRRGGARNRGAAFLLAAVLTVVPWTYRNYRVLHAFIPVATAGGLNLWQGNARLGREEVYVRYEQIHGRVEQYHHAIRKGLEAIWERQPGWIFEKLLEEMPNFWEADSQALVHLKRGAYGPTSPGAAWGAAAILLVPYLAALAFFVWGLATFRPTRPSLLFLGFLIYYTLLHIVTHGYARYRLPSLPVVFLFACVGFTSRGAPGAPRRTALALAVAVVLLVSLVPSFRLNAEDPAFGLAAPAPPVPEASPVP